MAIQEFDLGLVAGSGGTGAVSSVNGQTGAVTTARVYTGTNTSTSTANVDEKKTVRIGFNSSTNTLSIWTS